MSQFSIENQNICKAKLTNGVVIVYDLCEKSRYSYNSVKNKKYIGKGIIYEINGVLQTFTEIMHFWQTQNI